MYVWSSLTRKLTEAEEYRGEEKTRERRRHREERAFEWWKGRWLPEAMSLRKGRWPDCALSDMVWWDPASTRTLATDKMSSRHHRLLQLLLVSSSSPPPALSVQRPVWRILLHACVSGSSREYWTWRAAARVSLNLYPVEHLMVGAFTFTSVSVRRVSYQLVAEWYVELGNLLARD